jgi:hypothetical protein
MPAGATYDVYAYRQPKSDGGRYGVTKRYFNPQRGDVGHRDGYDGGGVYVYRMDGGAVGCE